MIAAVNGVLANVAATIGVLAAIVASLGVLAKTPFGKGMRWLWRRVVTDPMAGWLKSTIAEVADERIVGVLMRPNGGKSLHDVAVAVRRVESKLDNHIATTTASEAPHDP